MGLLAISLMMLFFGQQNTPVTVSGVAVRQGTGEALAKVTVTLYQDNSRPASVSTTTGPDGKFAFSNVTPGQYRISATRNGYVRAEYGDRSSNGCGTPISLMPGQKLENARIAMLPAGVISGHVVDPDREGLPGVSAHALKYVYENGRRVFSVVQTVQTNDLGEYRLYGLTPGRYYVAAAIESAKSNLRETLLLPDVPFIPAPPSPPTPGAAAPPPRNPVVFDVPILDPGPGDRYFPTYYPGVRDPEAARAVDLRPGESSAGIDLTVTLAQTVSVRGKIVSNLRGGAQTLAVTLLPRLAHPNAGSALRTSPVRPDGTFQISSVVPGTYYLVASGADAGGRLTGRTPIDVGDKTVEDAVIEVSHGFELNGRIAVDDEKVMTRLTGVSLSSLSPTSAVSASSTVSANINQPDGSFRLQGITAGDYLPFVQFSNPNGGPPDIYVKALRLGSQDVRDGIRLDSQPAGLLKMVIGNNGAVVQGIVVNDKQTAVAGATVVLVPDVFLRKRDSLYKTRTTDASGHFQINAVGPGEYKIFAWEEVENGAWQDPDFIRIYETRGKVLTLREGTVEQAQLSLIPSSGSIYGQCQDPSKGFR